MDRPLDPAARRRTLLRRTAFAVVVVAGLGACYALAAAWATPSVRRERVRIARVDREYGAG